MSEDYAGYVYILSNKAMPGIVKIGRSIHGGRTRAKDLYKKGGTGVPVPFKMEFEVWSEQCCIDEICVHERLSEYRINNNREFFEIDTIKAIEAVLSVVCGLHGLVVAQEPESITANNDLIPNYGYLVLNEFDAIFPDKRMGYILTEAIRSHLSTQAVIDALKKYKEEEGKTKKGIYQVTDLMDGSIKWLG